jgi:lipooligosaccharide transport system permease protein
MGSVQSTWQGSKVLVNPAKPMRWGAFYVAEFRIRGMLKWWDAIIAFGLGNPVLYLLSIGIGIGALVDKGTGGTGLDGVPYLTFLAPALLATAAIQGAMDEVTFPTIEGFEWNKTFYSINATAITSRQIVDGIMWAAMARCVIQVSLYELILVLFGALPISSIPVLTVVSSLAGFGFAAVMLSVTVLIKDDDGFFAIVGRFVLTPMFMFSGTYFPLATLPIYLQWIGWISPVWHATDLGRALSYGADVPLWLMLVHVAVPVGLGAVGLLTAYPQFKKRLSA